MDVKVTETPREHGGRDGLLPLLAESFTGIYLWHARRSLRRARWVRTATRGAGPPLGVSMLTLPRPRIGYVYYVAVARAARSSGVGGRLLDDAVARLRRAGALEVLAAARRDNAPSLGLLRSRGFAPTSFAEVARSAGLAAAALLWWRMVVAPGEAVFRAPL
jgi:ribosomal protein S18 acetylase RimI-like enzyme